MARKTRRTKRSYSSRSRTRSYGSRSRRVGRTRRSSTRSGSQTIRIVLEQPGANPARDATFGLKPAPRPRKARF